MECELSFGPFDLADLATAAHVGGRGRRRRGHRGRRRRPADPHPGGDPRPNSTIAVERDDDGLNRVSVAVHNTGAAAADKDAAIATSLIGTHLIAEVVGGEFVSLLEPPDSAADAVSRCVQHRCFPVLAGGRANATCC